MIVEASNSKICRAGKQARNSRQDYCVSILRQDCLTLWLSYCTVMEN